MDCNFIKKETGVFLSIFRNFKEHLFYRTPLGDCFCKFQKKPYDSGFGAVELQKGTTFQKGFSLNKQYTQKYVDMLFSAIFM